MCPAQYRGLTTRRIQDRISEHIGCLTRPSHKPEESAIYLHSFKEDHPIDWKGTTILSTSRTSLKLSYLESIYIKRGRNLVNGQDGLKLSNIWDSIIGKDPH